MAAKDCGFAKNKIYKRKSHHTDYIPTYLTKLHNLLLCKHSACNQSVSVCAMEGMRWVWGVINSIFPFIVPSGGGFAVTEINNSETVANICVFEALIAEWLWHVHAFNCQARRFPPCDTFSQRDTHQKDQSRAGNEQWQVCKYELIIQPQPSSLSSCLTPPSLPP